MHQAYPDYRLTFRNFSWSADTIDLQPRPANFADTYQHFVFSKTDIIFVAFGFNESFQGEEGLNNFRTKLNEYIEVTKAKAFNGKSGPMIVILSPIANENIKGVNAAVNNLNLKIYSDVMRDVAISQKVGFVDLFSVTEKAMKSQSNDFTFNGCHLNDAGYRLFANTVFHQILGYEPPVVNEELRSACLLYTSPSPRDRG